MPCPLTLETRTPRAGTPSDGGPVGNSSVAGVPTHGRPTAKPAPGHATPKEVNLQPIREPIFNVPGSVVALIGIFIVIHLVRQVLPLADDNWFVVAMAFVPARYAGYASEIAGGQIAAVTSFLTHMLVHGNLTHLMFNSAWFLAFGGAIALRIGSPRFLAFTAFTGLAGALTFLAFHFGDPIPVIGASGAVSGMMGGVMRFLFSAMDQGNFAALREAPKTVPLMSLSEALRDRRVLAITAIWLALNAITALGIPGISEGDSVAWEAHLGGYMAGFFCFGYFDQTPRKSRFQPRIVN
ncbi:MAG: rhomboid family intramembrane serine protease [Alphaproteobacteria bacterium]|nr:rhomboid family intramembrane serine protease [Alphaproteobacteria bacterium]